MKILFSYIWWAKAVASTLPACLFLLLILSTSCRHRLVPQHTQFNSEVKDAHGAPMLLGRCTRSRLQQAPYDSWFTKNYEQYRVDTLSADSLKPMLKGKRFIIFMGTWCGDSRREVPRMFKLLDHCGVDSNAIELIMVSNADTLYKQTPAHEERGWNIVRVPDLIVLDHGKEMGRVIESPVSSLEKDLLAITGKAAYTPHYAGMKAGEGRPLP